MRSKYRTKMCGVIGSTPAFTRARLHCPRRLASVEVDEFLSPKCPFPINTSNDFAQVERPIVTLDKSKQQRLFHVDDLTLTLAISVIKEAL
jgi:hypothetical protein